MKFILICLFITSILFIGCGKKNIEQKTETGKIETVEYKCPGMHCNSCEETIKTAVTKVNGVKEVVADSKNKSVKVIFAGGTTNKEAIEKVINDSGYDTDNSKSKNKHDCEKDME